MLILAFSGAGSAGASPSSEQRKAAADELIYDEIARRREATDLDQREDVFSLLLQARDEDGQPMTDTELRDELVTLLVAGHETTATGLAWAFDLLTHHPRVLERLRASLAAGETDYLDAVVKETLRVRPVIPGIGRVVRGRPFELGGWEIPEGVEINPLDRAHPPARRPLPRAAASSAPSASSARTRPTPTRGSRSAAAPAAAWGRASRRSRWPP